MKDKPVKTTRNGLHPDWSVYIISCSDTSLYTGITTDINRRFQQHQEGRGAKYFRARQPIRIVFLESGHTRSSASVREIEIKNMSRAEKMLLFSRVTISHPNISTGISVVAHNFDRISN